jgi:hypothetical protein
MRNISFHLTIPQFKAHTKDVTRRLGWLNLKPGQILQAVEKAQGLKKGEKIKKLNQILILKVSREPLSAITEHEIIREGFPNMTFADFIDMFCSTHKGCTRDTIVTRIEFKHYK